MRHRAGATEAQTLSGDETLELPEFDAPPADPLALLAAWIEGAWAHGVREPLALALATVDSDGRPSSRTVLLKQVDDRGLLFASHGASRKGRELAGAPWAAGTLYWRETLQQVTVAGPVEPTSAAESDDLFAARPLAAQATAIASHQSAPLDDERALGARAGALARSEAPLRRPEGWGGYRIAPETIEFWHGRSDRLHRRLRYERGANGWAAVRLQP